MQDHSPYDYGPLYGKLVTLPKSKPTSVVVTPDFTVECYSYGDRLVVIASRPTKSLVKKAWKLSPVKVNGRILNQVLTCEITRWKRKQEGYVVHGWTGNEHITFYFDRKGRLTEFYLSW
jgi:hypothetical protein